MALEKGYKLTDIRERYELLEKIHCGGQGNVVRAVRKEDGKPLILKLYHEGEITSWEDIEKANEGADKEIKFLARAKSQGREGVPKIMEYGTFGALEQPYMAMEEVTGSTLESILNAPGSNPTAEEAMKLALEIAQTLNYAHKEAGARPFVHRDLKPSSIIVTEKGQYVIIDWGTVKCGTGKTQFTTQFDSLYYTSPEVRFGEEIKPSADVYSLARIIEHSLLGRRFIENYGEVDRSDFAGLNVPGSFVDALMSAADDKAEKRPQSVAEFLQKLQEKKALVVTAARERPPLVPSASHEISLTAKERLAPTSPAKVAEQYDESKEALPTTWKFLYTNSDKVEGHLTMPIDILSIAESVGGDQWAVFGAAINYAKSVEGSQFTVFGAAVNIAKSVEGSQFAIFGAAVNIAKSVGGDQCAVLGAAVNIAKSVGGDQSAVFGAVNIAESVGGSQHGLVNIVTKELKKRQIGVINYANGSEFKQYGLLNFRPGKVWWNPEVSLFYYDRKKSEEAKKLRIGGIEVLVDKELNRIEKIEDITIDESCAEHTIPLDEVEENEPPRAKARGI